MMPEHTHRWTEDKQQLDYLCEFLGWSIVHHDCGTIRLRNECGSAIDLRSVKGALALAERAALLRIDWLMREAAAADLRAAGTVTR